MGAPIAVLLTIWAGPVFVPRTSPRKLILIGTGLTFIAFQWFAVLGDSKLEYFAAWCLYMVGLLSWPGPCRTKSSFPTGIRKSAAPRWALPMWASP